MKQWRGAWSLVVLALLLSTGAARAGAQSPTPTATPVYCAWDFTLSDFGYTPDTARWGTPDGVYSAGVGWQSVENHTEYYDYQEIIIAAGSLFPQNITMTRLRMTYDLNGSGQYASANPSFRGGSASLSMTISSSGTNQVVDWTDLSQSVGVIDINFTNAIHLGGYGSAGSYTLKMVEIWGFGASPCVAPTATPTATLTPTVTLTPSLTGVPPTFTPTSAAGGLFPTVDYRPYCTLTPIASMTATRVNGLDALRTPTATLNPGWPSYCQSVSSTMVAGDATLGAMCAQVTRVAYQQTATPLYPTLAGLESATPRTVGDCRPAYDAGAGSPQVDVSMTDYARDEGGNVIENCYTIFPYVHLGPPQLILDIINGLAGSTVVTVESSTLIVEDVSMCVKYRKFALVILGIDWMPLASGFMTFSIILFMIRTVRYEQ